MEHFKDTILDYKDRETVYIDGGYYYKATGTERQVGIETIWYVANAIINYLMIVSFRKFSWWKITV